MNNPLDLGQTVDLPPNHLNEVPDPLLKANIIPAMAGITQHQQRKISALVAGVAMAGLGLGSAQAQVRPDAGLIQQELERGTVPAPAPSPPAAPVVEDPQTPALVADGVRLFLVKGYRITRNTAFSEDDLLPLLKDFIDKELSFVDLERATDVITRFYRDRDYFVARAYVPVQEIKDGIVEITVLEGRLDHLSQKPAEGVRLKESVVEDTLHDVLPAEGLIRLGKLERGLLLLNDIPVVDVRSVLLPGSTLGTSIVAVNVKEGPLVTGNLDFDSYGNKFTGPFRLGATANLNDPSGFGDQLSLRANVSEGARFGRLAYQIPVGPSGFRLSGAYAETHYKLCCEFTALQASGDAQTATITAMYPFLRGRNANLYGSATYDAKHYFNSAITGTVSDKKANVIGLGLSGDNSDFLGSSGLNSFGLYLSSGQLNLDGWAADRVADAASVRSHGSYNKTAYYLTSLQRLGEATSLYAGLSGQLASTNLDSSEKFTLGGPFGMRAYPTGEAAGDEGLMFNLELRYYLQPSLQFATFIDYGEVLLHKNEWPGWQGTNTRITNRYALSGLGLALNWHQPGNFLVRASVAHPIGENPGRDANENDADNTKNRLRLWLQVVKFF